ncbi:MAG TPA: hypothetical protein VIM46_00495 [Luteolibacter sp.]
MAQLPPIATVFLATLSCALAGPTLTVSDKAGRSMEIELKSVSGDRVSFLRKNDGKAFDLPLATFDSASVARIRTHQAELGPAHPNYGIDVIVDKRRQKRSDSWYLVEQTVSAKVSLKNPDMNLPAPPVTVKVLYLAVNRRTGKRYSVLSLQSYPLTLGPGQTDTRDLQPSTTVYDSDNKGIGNIGGNQYEGYVLFVLDAKGSILQHQTTCAKLDNLFREEPKLKDTYLTLQANAELDEKFKPTGQTASYISPN